MNPSMILSLSLSLSVVVICALVIYILTPAKDEKDVDGGGDATPAKDEKGVDGGGDATLAKDVKDVDKSGEELTVTASHSNLDTSITEQTALKIRIPHPFSNNGMSYGESIDTKYSVPPGSISFPMSGAIEVDFKDDANRYVPYNTTYNFNEKTRVLLIKFLSLEDTSPSWGVSATHDLLNQQVTENTQLIFSRNSLFLFNPSFPIYQYPNEVNYNVNNLNDLYNISLPKVGTAKHFESSKKPIFTFTKPTRVLMHIPTNTDTSHLVTQGWAYLQPSANMDNGNSDLIDTYPTSFYEKTYPVGTYNMDPGKHAPFAFYLFEPGNYSDITHIGNGYIHFPSADSDTGVVEHLGANRIYVKEFDAGEHDISPKDDDDNYIEPFALYAFQRA